MHSSGATARPLCRPPPTRPSLSQPSVGATPSLSASISGGEKGQALFLFLFFFSRCGPDDWAHGVNGSLASQSDVKTWCTRAEEEEQEEVALMPRDLRPDVFLQPPVPGREGDFLSELLSADTKTQQSSR